MNKTIDIRDARHCIDVESIAIEPNDIYEY